MRKAPKRDTTERDIKNALLQIGATVAQLNDHNVPDLLVGYRGRNILLEVKTGKYSKLSPGQKEWHDNWHGQVATVKTVDEALAVVLDETV